MTDIAAFIHARLDEIEDVARIPSGGGYEPDIWETRPSRSGRWSHIVAKSRVLGEPVEAAGEEDDQPVAIVQSGRWEDRHIVLHDPNSVAIRVDVDRRILDLHALVWRDIGWLETDDDGSRDEVYAELEVCGHCVPKHSHYPTRADVPTGPCLTVRLLALSYAEHPDYQERWRP